MSDVATPAPAAQPVAADAAATGAAPAPAPVVEAAKPEPRKLPYGMPQRAPRAEAPVAAPVADAAKPESKPAASNRAAAMQRARADKLAAELEATRKTAGEVDTMRKVLMGYATDAVKSLSKEWQDHLKSLAGDDPAKLLELVQKTAHLRPQANASAATTIASAAPKAATEADEDVTIARRWQDLASKAPGRAAQLRLANGPAIDRGLSKIRAAG